MGHNESSAKRKEGMIIALTAYIKLIENSHIIELTAHSKSLEQNETSSHWQNRCQELSISRLKSIKKKLGKIQVIKVTKWSFIF